MPFLCCCGTMKSMSLAGLPSRSISGPGCWQCSRMPAEPTTRSVTFWSAAARTTETASACSLSQLPATVPALIAACSSARWSFAGDLLESEPDVNALPSPVPLDTAVPAGTADQGTEGDPRLCGHLGRVNERARCVRVMPQQPEHDSEEDRGDRPGDRHDRDASELEVPGRRGLVHPLTGEREQDGGDHDGAPDHEQHFDERQEDDGLERDEPHEQHRSGRRYPDGHHRSVHGLADIAEPVRRHPVE